MSNETTPTSGPKPKKSVALSGVAAGNTALCTVGRSGNDLHYRGYDILEIAEAAEFEEIAYLLVHEKLPTRAELSGYKKRLQTMRGIPASVKAVLECPRVDSPDGCHAHRRVGPRMSATRKGRPQYPRGA